MYETTKYMADFYQHKEPEILLENLITLLSKPWLGVLISYA